jgi:hypothetical protein
MASRWHPTAIPPLISAQDRDEWLALLPPPVSLNRRLCRAPRAGLDAMQEEEISAPVEDRNPFLGRRAYSLY